MEDTNIRITVDGCTAAAHVAYALSEVATVYPITPIASMGQTAQQWAEQGRKNFMGMPMQVKEMESELGAAGATHGALSAGSLATTFTSSQGLMLMIPNMYKIAGELLPAVFHVGTRSLASHALSIFGDHQDVMACRATGFAFLASNSVQETMDMAIVAHLAALESSVPICHFFDGWRTSNQMQTISAIPYDKIFSLIDRDALQRFRERGLNPEHPLLRGSAQNPDVYFQNREACNQHYMRLPAIIQACMDRVATITGRRYSLYEYSGHPQAEIAIVVMGSAGEVCEQAMEVLNTQGYKAGVLKVRLFRPFDAQALLKALPESVKKLTVLDRTKEPGADGEPLYKDVLAALMRSHRTDIDTFGGRFGLSSKEFDPSMVKAICDNMLSTSPLHEFTVGITDDVTHLSLPATHLEMPVHPGALEAIFYGFGSDGTVGATRQLARSLAATEDMFAQAYFDYSAKKSGGYTISQLRLDKAPIKADYNIEQADYVACHKTMYIHKYAMADSLKQGGIFLLNAPWTDSDSFCKNVPASLLSALATKQAKVYSIDADAIAAKCGLGVRINMIMAAAFLHLCSDRVDSAKALKALESQIREAYIHEGEDVVQKNLDALSLAPAAIKSIDLSTQQIAATDTHEAFVAGDNMNTEWFATHIASVCDRLQGNTLPVSAFTPDGSMPLGTTAYEKRRIALRVPVWNVDKCIECTLCSYVCAHAAIRPFLLDEAQIASAPSGFTAKAARLPGYQGEPLQWRIQVFTEDCTGCGSCAFVCPGHALDMTPASQAMDAQIPATSYCSEHVGYRPGIMPRYSVRGSQMYQPLLQFSGACAGCGETPYIKLLTQLFGERLILANATGCSSIWGADYPSVAYCTNAQGHGPAWANSLFEDNAEFGYGMAVAMDGLRAALRKDIQAAVSDKNTPSELVQAMQTWLAATADTQVKAASDLSTLLSKYKDSDSVAGIAARTDLLAPKSIWAIGGDGWAYDIGFAGLDHVLARRTNINILVMDTECYSNTGGQMSKATPIGAVAAYAPTGKRTTKKDLGRMMMTYGGVYVASVSMGANWQQTITALQEAEAWPGPSIVIAYCPCIMHGIRKGMGTAMDEEKQAVQTGYWPLYRYNPALAAQGKNPLSVDSQVPNGALDTFLDCESRYASLKERMPQVATELRERMAKRTAEVYEILTDESKLKDC